MNSRVLLLLASLAMIGCAHVVEPRVNHLTGEPNDLRPKVEHPVARAVLAPVNLAPNILANLVIGLYPRDVWPIQYLLLPISATIWGVQDTFLGYPFWSPSVLYE